MHGVDEEIVIGRRFRGPPRSGNGGYAAGLVAAAVGAPCVAVSLRAPPPLDVPLSVAREGERVRALDAGSGTTIAEAEPATLELDVPPVPSLAEVEDAERRYEGLHHHAFAECFVCGPARGSGDGLRIFAGPLAARPEVVASRWTPDASLAATDGSVDAAFLWAALDCPGYFATGLGASATPAVLARMVARVDARPEVGARLRCVAWSIVAEGRKHRVGTAVVREDGSVLARAESLWIALDEASARAFLG